MWHKEQDTAELKNDYINKNTFFLTPHLLKEYLMINNIIIKEKKRDTKNTLLDKTEELKEFLEFIANDPSEEEFLNRMDNKNFVDLFVTIMLGSYEFLSRLLILLDKYFNEQKIKDEKLNCYICNVKKKYGCLPDTSKKLKDKLQQQEIKQLLAYILFKMFSEDFKNYYTKNISDGELHEILGKSFLDFCKTIPIIKKVSKLIKNNNEIKDQILELLTLIYESNSKGMQKAKEGIEYEEILKEILESNDIPYHKEYEIKKDDKINQKTRRWDIYIPNKTNPRIVIEVMYMITTSSAMTNKQKVIIQASEKESNKIIIFVLMDGAGWITRWSDAKKILESDVYVFTFHKDSLMHAIEKIKKFINQK